MAPRRFQTTYWQFDKNQAVKQYPPWFLSNGSGRLPCGCYTPPA
ncbi:hypothetical protein NEISICOT_00466 [Neisseria sicca ATCC 29256]|uniref:Uncharacterized protein n=1 Tax=Neisseria sicca ATCC 29256 TaxID=547045 RepID=C6M1T0_NEISI|nr:hypothetical protein NEISICOT_00466 [Neisseria sicca ATCC 29256]